MKLYQLLLVLIIFMCSCNSKVDLKIPDHVHPTRNASSQQFPGSRIFITVPKGYQLVQQLLRFQKNDSTFVQVLEIPNTAYNTANFKQKIAENRASGKLAKEYYSKEFKFGDHEAILYYGPDTKPGLDQMVLCFGNNNFVIMAVGEVPQGDAAARDEILQSLLTTYVDTTIVADASVLANYTLDASNTEFKYVGNMSQTFFYNPGGSKLRSDDEFANQIMVSVLPAQSQTALKAYSLSMIERYKNAGMKIDDQKASETTLNGNYAHEIVFNGNYKDRPFSAYQIVITNGAHSVMFLGSAYDRREELMTQIKQVASTLRIK